MSAKPNPIRRRLSCPECGFIYKNENGQEPPADKYIIKEKIKERGTFDLSITVNRFVKCPRCEITLSWDAFWELNYGKWNKINAKDNDFNN